MKKIVLALLFATSLAYGGTITDTVGDKNTDDTLTAAEFNTHKNDILNTINGNIDENNIKDNAVVTDKINNDAVTPAKIDDDNGTEFTMKDLNITAGLTTSTFTATNSTTTNLTVTHINNSPTFGFGFSASTYSVTNATVTAVIHTSTVTLSSPVTRYWTLSPTAFVPDDDNRDWEITEQEIRDGGNFGVSIFHGQVQLPHDAHLIKIQWYHFRDDGAATSQILLEQLQLSGGAPTTRNTLATLSGAGTGGWTSEVLGLDTTIDTRNDAYSCQLTLDANDAVTDVTSSMIVFTYTIQTYLP